MAENIAVVRVGGGVSTGLAGRSRVTDSGKHLLSEAMGLLHLRRHSGYREGRWSDLPSLRNEMTMAYEPAQLESFLAVAQTGSFPRAASRLGIRQPTVSQHIRKLEEATGRLLVLRDTHSVSLTVDGEAMIDF